jgi:hypothetical protein
LLPQKLSERALNKRQQTTAVMKVSYKPALLLHLAYGRKVGGAPAPGSAAPCRWARRAHRGGRVDVSSQDRYDPYASQGNQNSIGDMPFRPIAGAAQIGDCLPHTRNC